MGGCIDLSIVSKGLMMQRVSVTVRRLRRTGRGKGRHRTKVGEVKQGAAVPV